MRNIKLSTLDLVCPPISDREAYSLMKHPSVERKMRNSDIYMIGAKRSLTFSEIKLEPEYSLISFTLCDGKCIVSKGKINVSELEFAKKFDVNDCKIYPSEKEIQIEFIIEPYIEGLANVQIFTPEMLLWYKSIGHQGIYELDNFKELQEYELLYVGIAKKGDSFDRLIRKGHSARQKILSQESQRRKGALVSEEIFLFLFKLEPLYIRQFSPVDEINDEDLTICHDNKKVIADAEKAFVSLFQPKYNTVRFCKYPKGADGLYNDELDAYSYSINEYIVFNTPKGQIKGARAIFGSFSNEADTILVDKEKAILYIGS